MQRFDRKLRSIAAVVALMLLVAACSSDVGLEDFNLARKAANVVNINPLAFSAPREDLTLRPATAADLVGPDGQCANAAPAPAPAAAADPSGAPADPAAVTPPLVQGGIALQMTECEVVARAGAHENIEFGTNARGERTVVLTYIRGSRPGIYRFAAGRLYSIERAPEPPAPAKPKKAAPAKRKPAPA